ncbi:protein RGF1 INDUCIBLE TRANSCRIPTION FACTOR 1-like [Impatiens glandulifera]|uniref:protein RGF1 INDUCIBLE TRANSCRIPTION FACTOR 1-like n=1 Tax=Impatiens glandulifera TaxID=253017 RepID=UPI001FB0D05D|nr:protein RGF1 INDUCIBLE TRANSCRIPTION FACTOR 1-like [Impatiens glandulifera]
MDGNMGKEIFRMNGIQRPAWLEALIHLEKFFVPCSNHEFAKKNEKNVLCLDCCTSLCPHCIPLHRVHRLLQVRRYVYHDVVRMEDLEKLVDCSNVQAYTINSSKVMFIKKRPQNRQFKGSGNYCTSCDRSLQEPFIHCSLGCKVEFILKHYKDLTPYLRPCKTLQLGPDFFVPQDHIGEYYNDETGRSTIVDSDQEAMSWSTTTSSESENTSMVCPEFPRKKRSGLYNVCGRLTRKMNSSENHHVHNQDMMMSTNISGRRKGIPHRSPLC